MRQNLGWRVGREKKNINRSILRPGRDSKKVFVQSSVCVKFANIRYI
jgi:hypothetical protein